MNFPTHRALRWCAALLAIQSLGTSAALASMPMCVSHRLPAADKAVVRDAIIQTAGQHSIRWSTQLHCIKRDGGNNSSSVQLDEQRQADDSLVHFFVLCERANSTWKCHRDQWRNANVDVVIEGREKSFDLTLPVDFELAAARRLLHQARDVAPTTTAGQQCDLDAKDPPDPDAEKSLRSHQETFRFLRPKMVGSIEAVEDGSFDLVMDTDVLRFAIDANDATKITLRCWYTQPLIT